MDWTQPQGLTDPLLTCHWFCCSYFHKLVTKTSSCQSSDILYQQSLWNRKEFGCETSSVVGCLPLLAGSLTLSVGMGSLSGLMNNHKNTNWIFCLAFYIILQPLTNFIKVSLQSLLCTSGHQVYSPGRAQTQKPAYSDSVALYLSSRCCIYSSERVPEQERDKEHLWQCELE